MAEAIIATLYLRLRSAATFGRGDGVAGLVDREVEHDKHGFPFLRGRTLKGLLREAAEDFIFVFEHQQGENSLKRAKDALFGIAGSGLEGQGNLRVGDARLPLTLRRLFLAEKQRQEKGQSINLPLRPTDMLESLTGIRRQTAMNPYGAPDHATLRSMRVILRDTIFEAELAFNQPPTDDEWTLLVAAVLGLRAAGTGRNRGRGWLQATLNDDETMRRYWTRLKAEE